MTRVKVCGITRKVDLDAAVSAGADAVGVIADVPVDTPREVTSTRATDLLTAVPPFVTGVLVTMPETPSQALELVEAVQPDALQIHGSLSTDDLETVVAGTDVPVLRAVSANEPDAARRADLVAAGLVIDSTTPAGAGGTGRTHDWNRTGDLVTTLDSPVVLAGGLTPDNVANAVATARPFAVDVASGVERSGGIKDHEAIEQFVEHSRRLPAMP